jgi:hypothetical protein
MKDEDARLTPGEEQELIGAILRRTSGGACSRAEELMPEYAADLEVGAAGGSVAATGGPVAAGRSHSRAEADDLALLASHLEHCAPCRELARNLAVAAATLPSLAAFDPGPAFTAAVLQATSRAEVELSHVRLKPDATAPLGHIRLKPDATYIPWWQAWLARPRFAFEVAYVATVLILLVAGNPASTLQAASGRTASAAAAGLGLAREAWPNAVSRVMPASIELPASVRALGSVTGGVVERGGVATKGLSGAWSRALAQWSVTWTWVRGAAADLAVRVTGTLLTIRDTVARWVNQPATEPRAPAAR